MRITFASTNGVNFSIYNLALQNEKFETARFELHQLLAQPTLKGVPLLVVRLQYSLRSERLSSLTLCGIAWEQERPGRTCTSQRTNQGTVSSASTLNSRLDTSLSVIYAGN